MGWETRRGKQYYYRKYRVDGRVVNEYIGSGPEAEAVAEQDRQEREARAAARTAAREEMDTFKTTIRQLDELHMMTTALQTATLLQAGYHQHKGQWRKKRERKSS